uniref:Uncharacterized protein LOC104229503 n=1 Tax=Nicotiana sylvestris TaxID=4096 RepID=A0A1U7WPF8_NICSY|nr:PREDICTED: uncharacterized protein LOC104229503 [Nicotiana sylvestris]XP_009780457.1 PREDICTED: uncharacterized protein LOC104229503 [Nicotiana sylvestris]XP_009780458.1 PREDICTED: uncharacterized protein LOC104229503 [Nicotiana sylvestris]
MVQYKADFQGNTIPFKFEAQHMCHQKVIVEKDTIEPDQYHVGRVHFHPSWLVDDIAGDVKPGINLKNRVVDNVSEAQIKYRMLHKRAFESKSRHLEHYKVDMEAINGWREIATKATERLEYLEQGLMELERKMRNRVAGCQNMDGNEGGLLARVYLLLDMHDLGI